VIFNVRCVPRCYHQAVYSLMAKLGD